MNRILMMIGLKNTNHISVIKQFANFFLTILIVSVLIIFTNPEPSDKLTRSTSLKRIKTEENGYERIDYVDDNNIITYAADKHYASKIITREENTILEEFLGTDGEPCKQNLGYYSILRFLNENSQEYKTVYLDLNKQPVMNKAGYASIERTYGEKGETISELFFDENGKPVETNLLGYGCIYEYDNDGRNYKTIYLGANGKPCISGQGYAIIHKSFYEEGDNKGKVKDEFYFDEKEEPIKLKNGQYGLHREYDEVGRTNKYTYLGMDGEPIVTVDGYTTVICSYYNDDSVKSYLYYDKNGEPVALAQGQYGVIRRDGKSIWLDKNGNEIISLRNLLFGSKWFSLLMCCSILIISSVINTRYNKILLVMYIGFIILITLYNRSESAGGIQLVPFWSYGKMLEDKELATEIFYNILLFVPLAVILYKIHPTKTIILPIIAFSILIECAQYIWHIGLCEIDDIISNTIGSIAGYRIAKHLEKLICKEKTTGSL